jgi:hypothetical protein
MRANLIAQATQNVIARQIRDRVTGFAARLLDLLSSLHAHDGSWRFSGEGCRDGLKRFKPHACPALVYVRPVYVRPERMPSHSMWLAGVPARTVVV